MPDQLAPSHLLKAGLVTPGPARWPSAPAGRCPPTPSPSRARRWRSVRVPWGLAFLPNGNALVGERTAGRIHRVSRTAAASAGRPGRQRPPARRRGRPARPGAAPRLRQRPLGLRLHHLARATTAWCGCGTPTAGSADRTSCWPASPANTTHNGGRLRFDPTDTSSPAPATPATAPSRRTPTRWAGRSSGSPPTARCPTATRSTTTRVELGHRNVEGLAFDDGGRLWATELGENTRDELNRIVQGRQLRLARRRGRRRPGRRSTTRS